MSTKDQSAVDLRSDTITRPSAAMLDAMMSAKVGDDVYGEDHAVNELQQLAAEMFRMESALFCPSGTMSNQIGIRLHTRPGDEIVCHELAHVYRFEGGGTASNAGVSVRPMRGEYGKFSAAALTENINQRDDSHLPWTRLVAIENTTNFGGGSCWSIEDLLEIREVCDQNDLRLHLDGARIFNAMIAGKVSAIQFGELSDTISICLSKGLGAPVGSLLLGDSRHIAKAHRIRKSMGGGMRQAGFLAAAGTYALNNHVERLADDHARAKLVGHELGRFSYVERVLPVETNIVIFELAAQVDCECFQGHLRKHRIRALTRNGRAFRLVFHLDIDDSHLEQLLTTLRSFGT